MSEPGDLEPLVAVDGFLLPRVMAGAEILGLGALPPEVSDPPRLRADVDFFIVG